MSGFASGIYLISIPEEICKGVSINYKDFLSIAALTDAKARISAVLNVSREVIIKIPPTANSKMMLKIPIDDRPVIVAETA